MPTFRRIRRTIAAVLLTVYLPSCYHWITPKGITPQEYVTTKHPKQVRVTLVDSTRRTVLRQPWVSADSIGGRLLIRADWYYGARVGPPWAVPLSSVQRMEVRKLEPVGTTFAILVPVLLIGGLVTWAIACASYPEGILC
jgi:hypothetical protein